MDGKDLGDFLECSVCLESLDRNHKVLPCQHTFCVRCLQDLEKKGRRGPPANDSGGSSEQRLPGFFCPECRALVDAPLSSLPTNIILNRILEGLEKRQCSSTFASDKLSRSMESTPLNERSAEFPALKVGEHRRLDHFISSISSAPAKVNNGPVLESREGSSVHFSPLQTMETPTKKSSYLNSSAKIPGNVKTNPFLPLMVPDSNDEDQHGREPRELADKNLEFKSLSSLLQGTSSSDGLLTSSTVTPRHTELKSSIIDAAPKSVLPVLPPKPPSSSSSSDVNRRVQDQRLDLKLSHIPPPSRPPPPPPVPTVSASTPSNGTGGSSSSRKEHGRGPHQVYRALYHYMPVRPDELELQENMLYFVINKCKDGWFRGSSLATLKTGVFPGNYVQHVQYDGRSNDTTKSSDKRCQSASVSFGFRRSNSNEKDLIDLTIDDPHPSAIPKTNEGDVEAMAPNYKLGEWHRAILAYPPSSEYELELQVGDLLLVTKEKEEGWCKGFQQRTGKIGLFPVSFVQKM